jgi:hypothetical protein
LFFACDVSGRDGETSTVKICIINGVALRFDDLPPSLGGIPMFAGNLRNPVSRSGAVSAQQSAVLATSRCGRRCGSNLQHISAA